MSTEGLSIVPAASGVVWEPGLDSEGGRLVEIAREITRASFAPLAEELDREQRYPWESLTILRDTGLATMFIPKVYGGGGASLAATAAVCDEIAWGCASTSAILNAYVLGSFALLFGGSEDQKQKYLREMVDDGAAISFALTELDAGSDASQISTRAEREKKHFRLIGEKCFIGNGGASRYYVVFAQTGGGTRSALTAFIVDRESDGVVIDRFEDKMGIRGTLTSNLRLDTLVPESAVLGNLGAGMRLALGTLNVGRIAVAGQAVGIGRAAFDHAADRSVTRTTFGQKLIDHQGIGFRLADVAVELSAARMLVNEAARRFDLGLDVSLIGAMAKLYASEASHRAVDAAVQVFGGAGYCRPAVVERLYRDQRVTEIYDGTSEIQRMIIARSIKARTVMPNLTTDQIFDGDGSGRARAVPRRKA